MTSYDLILNPYRHISNLPIMAHMVEHEEDILEDLQASRRASVRLRDRDQVDRFNAVINYQRWRLFCARKRVSQITD